MQLYTSYFYQIRNFPKNLIPLSTAIWDPKWYHEGKSQSNIFLDKRGVLNGMRIEELAPGSRCANQCHGIDQCYTKDPSKCDFLMNYRSQLDELDFKEFIKSLCSLSEALAKINNLEEVDFAFIFHEDPSNKCSEREAVQEWLKNNGIEVTEFASI